MPIYWIRRRASCHWQTPYTWAPRSNIDSGSHYPELTVQRTSRGKGQVSHFGNYFRQFDGLGEWKCILCLSPHDSYSKRTKDLKPSTFHLKLFFQAVSVASSFSSAFVSPTLFLFWWVLLPSLWSLPSFLPLPSGSVHKLTVRWGDPRPWEGWEEQKG